MLVSRPRIGSDFPSGIVDVARLLTDDARDRRPRRKAITQSCLPLAIVTCYARPVNRNIFYIIGVIVVVIIVLKVLGLF
jgi:hypothetical protein